MLLLLGDTRGIPHEGSTLARGGRWAPKPGGECLGGSSPNPSFRIAHGATAPTGRSLTSIRRPERDSALHQMPPRLQQRGGLFFVPLGLTPISAKRGGAEQRGDRRHKCRLAPLLAIAVRRSPGHYVPRSARVWYLTYPALNGRRASRERVFRERILARRWLADSNVPSSRPISLPDSGRSGVEASTSPPGVRGPSYALDRTTCQPNAETAKASTPPGGRPRGRQAVLCASPEPAQNGGMSNSRRSCTSATGFWVKRPLRALGEGSARSSAISMRSFDRLRLPSSMRS